MKFGFSQREKRPVLHIPLSTAEIILEMTALAGVFFIVLIALQAWPTLPETIPTHFGPSGRPDGWGSKASFWLLPALTVLLIYTPITFLSRYPHLYNYPWPITAANAKAQYLNARLMMNCLKVEIICMFAYVHWMIVQSAQGRTDGLGNWFLPFTLAVILGTLAIYFFTAYQDK